jgi:hypothetical protein
MVTRPERLHGLIGHGTIVTLEHVCVIPSPDPLDPIPSQQEGPKNPDGRDENLVTGQTGYRAQMRKIDKPRWADDNDTGENERTSLRIPNADSYETRKTCDRDMSGYALENDEPVSTERVSHESK